MDSSTSQSKASLTNLAAKLSLKIPPHSSSSSSPTSEFNFSDVFGPPQSNFIPSPYSPSPIVCDPQIIRNLSHSFIGPSPRYPVPTSHPFHAPEEIIPQISDDDDDEKEEYEQGEEIIGNHCNCSDKVKEKGEERDENRKIGPEDFEILRLVGRGAFGKVFQVRKKGSFEIGDGDGIFAMKVMRKDNIIKKNHVDYMKSERDILTKVVHPFIVQLRYSFQLQYVVILSFAMPLPTKSKLYLILDFINGGHLFFHLYRQGIFREDQARLYTAEIVSAVSHLHKSGIVHRDLKPENILIDTDGHVVLTDFGLAKEIDESSRSNSMCGTVEYMAPEILLSKGHNKDADWWSVGVLLYEMLTGQPPFTHANRKKLQQRIINEKVKFPPFLTSEAHSLLKGLLQKDPSKRLGSGGADAVKNHRWFRTINWKKLEAREVQPKFKPTVGGKDCIANFDECWTTMPADDSPANTFRGILTWHLTVGSHLMTRMNDINSETNQFRIHHDGDMMKELPRKRRNPNQKGPPFLQVHLLTMSYGGRSNKSGHSEKTGMKMAASIRGGFDPNLIRSHLCNHAAASVTTRPPLSPCGRQFSD